MLEDFDSARAHLQFYFVLKLSHVEQWPWKILRLSHADETLAQQTLQEALVCGHAHSLLDQLRGPLEPICRRWLAGESLSDPGLEALGQVVASLRFIPTNARSIEGQHAKTHKLGLGRPNHSHAFQSYGLRIGELTQELEQNPEFIRTFAQYVQLTRNTHRACQVVGLLDHPSLHIPGRQVVRRRDPLMALVIYHADPWTLYASAPPVVNLRPPPGRGGRPNLQLEADIIGPPVGDLDHPPLDRGWSLDDLPSRHIGAEANGLVIVPVVKLRCRLVMELWNTQVLEPSAFNFDWHSKLKAKESKTWL